MIYTAIIIEPRSHLALKFVLGNFLENLNEYWSFIILYGNGNKDYLFKIIKNNYLNHLHRIKLINLDVSNLSISDYNKIFFDKNFYNLITTEFFLIFQCDTVICKKYKNYIYNFLRYDYVGAPWLDPNKVFNTKYANNVGNGGLSLRKKTKMLEILDKFLNNDLVKNLTFLGNEDYFFTRKRNNFNINLPTIENAKLFSIETLYSNKCFGVHKPWGHLLPLEFTKLINDNPEINELYNLNMSNKKIKDQTPCNNNLIIGKIKYIEEKLL